jgi:autotransporter translocation and assembly factor TamB
VRRIAFALFAALVLLALAAGTRELWAGPLLVRWLRSKARAVYGAELTVERVSGLTWRGFVLEGVRWRSARPPLLALDDGRIELELDLLGRDRLRDVGLSVTARGVRLAAGASDAGGPAPAGDARVRVELDLADVELELAGGEALRLDAARGNGEVQGGEVRVAALELVAGANRLELADASLAPRSGDVLEVARSFRGTVRAHCPDARVLARALDLPLRSAELELRAAGARASLAGRLAFEGGTLEIGRGALALPEAGGLAGIVLDLESRAAFHDLAPLGALAGLDLAGSWSGSVAVRGPLRAPSGRFEGHGQSLVIGGLAVAALDVDVETDGKRARFERCEASSPHLEAVLRGEVRLHPLELVDVALNLAADGPALAPFVSFPLEHAFLHARLAGPPAAPRGEIELSASGFSLAGRRVDDAAARGRLDGPRFELEELRLASGESALEASGVLARSADGITAEVAGLALEWRGTRIEAAPGARATLAGASWALEDLELSSRSAAGEGRARVELRYDAGTTRGSLLFEDYEAGPVLAAFLPDGWRAGRASGRLAGALGAPGAGAAARLELDLALSGWTAGPAWPAFDARLRGSLAGGVLALESLELGFGEEEGARLAGALRIPFDPLRPLRLAPGDVSLAATLTSGDIARTLRRAGLESGLARSGGGRLEADLAGSWRSLRGRVALRGEELTLGSGSRARSADLAAEVELGDEVRIARAVCSAPSGTVSLSGTLGIPVDLEGWVADPAAWLEAPLALRSEVELADVGWTAALADETFRRLSGGVHGEVALGGLLRQPEFTGRLAWTGGELRLASGAPPVRRIEAEIVLEGDVVRIASLAGEIGGAPLRVAGTLEPFGPFPRLDLALRGEDVLLARDAHLVLRADADLVVKGTPSQLAIRGELALAEGRYHGEISPLEELLRAGRLGREPREEEGHVSLWSSGPLADATFDVHLGGARTFAYRTNLLEAELRPDAWLRGTGDFPLVEGPVYVEGASLVLPSGKLRLESGLLTFRREEPLRPTAALMAEMRVQRHDVRAVATGHLDELEIVLSSSPPLASDDLWILVLSGQLPTTRWQDRSAQAMEALALFLARDGLVRWFGSDPDDAASLLERFEIDVGAKTSLSGQPTGRVLFYLRPESRKSGRATYLSAELDEYDRVNYALGIVFRPR